LSIIHISRKEAIIGCFQRSEKGGRRKNCRSNWYFGNKKAQCNWVPGNLPEIPVKRFSL